MVTGGAGILGRAICRALVRAGARVVVLDLCLESAQALAAERCAASGEAIGVGCDVLDRSSVEAAARGVLEKFGRADILVNGAGGNRPQAKTSADQPFFDLPADAMRSVVDLNLLGTMLPSQVFGKWQYPLCWPTLIRQPRPLRAWSLSDDRLNCRTG